MNLNEIKAKLDKLNRYFEFLNSAEDKISQLDKDVFLSHLRDLYDSVLFSESAAVKTEAVSVKPVEIKKAVEKEETKKTPKLIFNEKESTITTEKEEPVFHNAEKTAAPEKSVEEPKTVAPVIDESEKEEKITVSEIVETETSAKEDDPNTDFNESFEELFFFKQATDLAEKLSESPISNLTKALGVNEKLYYIKELFGGDAAKFNETISFFNEAGLFDKARLFMEYNLIEQYDWMNKDRKAIAKEFIKLVRRRYL